MQVAGGYDPLAIDCILLSADSGYDPLIDVVKVPYGGGEDLVFVLVNGLTTI